METIDWQTLCWENPNGKKNNIYVQSAVNFLTINGNVRGLSIGLHTKIYSDVVLGADTLIGKECVIGRGVTTGFESTILNNCIVGDDTHLSALSILQDNVIVGANCQLGYSSLVREGAHLDHAVSIGARVKIGENVRLKGGTRLGARAIIADNDPCDIPIYLSGLLLDTPITATRTNLQVDYDVFPLEWWFNATDDEINELNRSNINTIVEDWKVLKPIIFNLLTECGYWKGEK